MVSALDQERVVDPFELLLEGEQALAPGPLGQRHDGGHQVGGGLRLAGEGALTRPRTASLASATVPPANETRVVAPKTSSIGGKSIRLIGSPPSSMLAEDDDDQAEDDPDQGCRIHQCSVPWCSWPRLEGCSVTVPSRVGCGPVEASAPIWTGC